MRKYAACVVVIFVSLFGMIYGQSDNQEEVTVEQAYLSSVEDIIIMELAASDGRDNKLVSLQYIESALDNGKTSPDIQNALESLAGEGLFNLVTDGYPITIRTSGQERANFLDVWAMKKRLPHWSRSYLRIMNLWFFRRLSVR